MALAFGALPVTPSPVPSQARAPLSQSGSGPRARARSRAFTMLEVLTVVVIIGVLAATASPIMISILRDRNVARMAMRVGDVYRFARALALERQAVLVRYNLVGGPAGSPGLEIREAVVIDAGAPAPTCAGIANGSTQLKLVTSFPAAPANPAQNPPWEDAAVDFRDPAGAMKAYAEVCYTSRGATWVRYDPSEGFIALQGVPQINVTNTRTGMRRTIFIPPSTVARLAL